MKVAKAMLVGSWFVSGLPLAYWLGQQTCLAKITFQFSMLHNLIDVIPSGDCRWYDIRVQNYNASIASAG